METRGSTHPAAEVLQAFGLGKLDDDSSAAVMNHLDLCADCRKVVASLSGDDFLDRLRQAHGTGTTPAPASSLADTDRRSEPPTTPTVLVDPPPELADNPQYEVLRELGRGGMGVVYLARNRLMDRLEVLKVINRALLDRPGAAERFLREIRSAARLNHANVVTAYSALRLGDLLVFAMEFVEGQDLAAVVKSGGPLPVADACSCVRQAALGLQHAFEKGMVHRDIKPQNLMRSRGGGKHLVKVLDFGLAKVVRDTPDDTGLTGEGRMLGTPDYMAPEQTRDATSADTRADVYSLGCTLYYLLTGSPPFRGKSLFEIMQAHQSTEAPALNLARPEVPAELAAVVRKMMAKDRAQRYQTPLDVAQALAPFTEEAPRKRPGRRARHPGWLAGGVAAGLLLGLLGLWAGGVFKVRTAHGTIVLEGLPADAVVEVDGDTVALDAGDGKPVVIGVTAGRTHRLQVRKEGFRVFGTEVEIDAGGRRPVAVRLEPAAAPAPPAPAAEAAGKEKRLAPLDEAWVRRVRGLSAGEQVKEVVADLRRRNPNFDGKVTPDIQGDQVVGLWFLTDNVTDISPVRALPRLRALSCIGSAPHQGKLADLTPLRGMELTLLDCSCTEVADLTPLKGMPLRRLTLWVTQATNLAPLKGMPLDYLNLAAVPVADLTPLHGLPLTSLFLNGTRVRELAPLRGMPLEHLHIGGTPVADLSPLAGLPLTTLSCFETQIEDLTPLKTTKLISLDCYGTRVKDVSPLAGLKLTVLGLHFTRVADIAPLKGMPLTFLNCQGLPITDLSAVKGMPLDALNCAGTRVVDLAPLKRTPLRELYFDYQPKRGDRAVLDAIKTLEKLNGKPAADFWKAAAPAR